MEKNINNMSYDELVAEIERVTDALEEANYPVEKPIFIDLIEAYAKAYAAKNNPA